MDERGIIIADSDGEYRKEMARFFEKAGYAVETSDSAVHVLCSILEKQTPVLLLGNNFDKKVSSADLIHLLKKCNRHLHVIMVSDDLPLAQAREVRQEGIFYHALKPASPTDTGELGLAVECAFGKSRGKGASDDRAAPGRRGEVQGEKGGGGATDERPRFGHSGLCSCEKEAEARNPFRALQWLIALVVVVMGTSWLSLVAAQRATEGNSMAIWIFLAFCAFIVTTQLLPIFRIKRPFGGAAPVTVEQQDEESAEKEIDHPRG